MMQMARPRKPRRGEDQTAIYYFDDESRRKRLQSYNAQDVAIEREVYGRLLPLPPQEQKLWELDARINDRGFHVDIALARAAHQIALAAGPEINAELAAITEGAATSANQIAKLQEWLKQHGCTLRSLDKKTIEALLDQDNELPHTVRRVLQLRLDGGQLLQGNSARCRPPSATIAASEVLLSIMRRRPAASVALASIRRI